MKTKRGIYLNLQESEYYIRISSNTFYFSSEVYLKKFANNVKSYVNEEMLKFKVKYKINIDLSFLFMISYYQKIEKRGFRIYNHIANKEITKNVSFIQSIINY